MAQVEIDTSNTLPFDEDGQMAVLGWMLKNREFCYKCKATLADDLFVTSQLGEIFSALVIFIKEYNDIPTKENLITLFSSKKNEDFIKFKKTINDCLALSEKFTLPFLQRGITVWLQTAVFRDYTIKVSKHYKTGNIPMLQTMMKSALDKISDINFMKGVNYDFGNPIGDLLQSVSNKETCVTTGLKVFDAAMGGGLLRGEHTVVLAPLNIGKTKFCLNMLYHNIMNKKYCIFVVHEGIPLELMNNLRQRFLERTTDDLHKIAIDKKPEDIETLNIVEELLKKYLVFKPILKSGGLYVEDVVEEIKSEQEKLFSKTGHYFDLVIDDYPAKLQSRYFNNKNDKRNILQYIYEEFHRVAMEFNCHAISPAQINREGYKENKKREPGEYLGIDNVSESFGIGQDADNVLTLNRSDLDDKSEALYINIDKTRRSKHKQILQFTTDYSKCITHDESLGCTNLTAGSKNVTLKALNNESDKTANP